MHRWFIALLVLAPLSAADHERSVWQDGSHTSFAQEGVDLLELQMWEADLRDAGPGVMLRLLMQSGSQTGTLGTLHVNGTILGTSKQVDVHLWSEDHLSWNSDQRIFAQTSVASSPLPSPAPYPLDRWDHDVRVFIPLSDLGVQVGQRIDGFVFTAQAQGEEGWTRLDTAPGGFWLPGSDVEVPEFGAVPSHNAFSLTADDPASVFLGGAGHHLNATGTWSNGILSLYIRNPYNETDQALDILVPSGVTTLSQPTSVPANTTVRALYQVEQTAEAQHLVWDIRSDIGGVALLELDLEAVPAAADPPEPPVVTIKLERTDPVVKPVQPTPPAPTEAPATQTEPVKKDSPAGALLAVLGLGAVLVLRRK